jgi:hypothetical protein
VYWQLWACRSLRRCAPLNGPTLDRYSTRRFDPSLAGDVMARRERLDPASAGSRARYLEVAHGRHFTLVTVDPDNFVYAAQASRRPEDGELHAGFADALDRYRDAAYDYLWVNGYSGGFLYGNGPSYRRNGRELVTAHPRIVRRVDVRWRAAEIERLGRSS